MWQPGLFELESGLDHDQATAARGRMRQMIARLAAAAVPFWDSETAVILDDGAFQRAMRLVPEAEAQALWAEFDAHTVRLYAIWEKTRPAEA